MSVMQTFADDAYLLAANLSVQGIVGRNQETLEFINAADHLSKIPTQQA